MAQNENKKRSISLLFGEVTLEKISEVIAWIISENTCTKEDRVDRLDLYVNSNGGNLAAAFSLVEVMKGSDIPVSTIGVGEICSAGLIIFSAGTKGYRILTPSCSVMSHHFSAELQGNYHDLINVQKELNFFNKRIISQYANSTGMSEKDVMEKLIPTRDVYLNPEEALELGLADEIRGLRGIN